MAVTTEGNVTTLTPTPWKWNLAGTLTFLIFPIGTFFAIVCFLTASGKLQRITLSPEGIELRNWWTTKRYGWDEVGEIRINKLRSGPFVAAKMVSFTHTNQEGTLLGKAAKFLSGGTHALPVLGMKAKQQAVLMLAYKQGRFGEVSVPAASVPAPAAKVRQAIPQEPEPKPQQVRPQPARPAQAARKPQAAPSSFGRKKKYANPANTAPLIQSGRGRVFGKARKSPFG